MSEHFQPKEFASKDGRPSPYPLVVQEGLYQLLEEIRDEFGKPIVVNSGYRSPEHNKNIGGAKNSYHVKGMAADIRLQSYILSITTETRNLARIAHVTRLLQSYILSITTETLGRFLKTF